MVPAKSRTMKEHIIHDDIGKSTEVLPLVTIYGANASGKTNLVNAIDFMRDLVLKGTHPEKLTGVTPHRLDPSIDGQPSRFEIIFKHDGILYTYGFVASPSVIHEEWLFGYYTAQESKLFERITKDTEVEVDPGKRLTSDVGSAEFIKFLSKGTRPNQLFLTEAHNKNVKILKPVIHWLREHLHIVRPDSLYSSLALRAYKDKDFITYLSKFLKIADTGINEIKCETEEFDPNKHLSGFPEDLRMKVNEDLNAAHPQQILIHTPNESITISKEDPEGKTPTRFLRLKTEHVRADGKSTLFNVHEESDGTKRLMHLVPMLMDIWQRDRVFVIDELDRSLHTHLSRLFIKSCLAGVAEKNARGQFIMTTHDTNLLDRTLLRRDEILFMEKDHNGASHLTSLAEYKVSEGLNYENGYLNGRFGAIPFLGNTKELLK